MDGIKKVSKKYKEQKKMKQFKKKKLIIRNLSFKINEDDLKNMFSQFGNLSEVKIPKSKDGKKRGFAFIQFEDTSSLIKAMKSMNYKEIKGRRIAVDYAINKTSYQLKLQNIKEEKIDSNTEEKIKVELQSSDESDFSEKKEHIKEKFNHDYKAKENDEVIDNDKVKLFLKEFDATRGSSSDVSEEDSLSGSSDDETCEDASLSNEIIKKESDSSENLSVHSNKTSKIIKKAEDLSEGKTVFLRNISFSTTQDSLSDAMMEHGDFYYCLLCIDKVTGHSKGTGFVKFKEKSSADEIIEKSSQEPGIFIDGRRLNCSPAISKEKLSTMFLEKKKPVDKRNLRLLKIGSIIKDSEESKNVSLTDMAKRTQLEFAKNQKLKNINFFVSDKRLMISNLPRNFADKDLRALFKTAVRKQAVITEAKVMKELKKVDSTGKALSKGFGFVSFSQHDDALKALMELNNNPNIFTASKRPIVEFSVESKMALLTKERRKEKLKMESKRKFNEANLQNQDNKRSILNRNQPKKRKFKEANLQNQDNKRSILNKNQPKKGKKNKNYMKISNNIKDENHLSTPKNTEKGRNQMKQKSFKKSKKTSKFKNVERLANMYKEKLMNKLS